MSLRATMTKIGTSGWVALTMLGGASAARAQDGGEPFEETPVEGAPAEPTPAAGEPAEVAAEHGLHVVLGAGQLEVFLSLGVGLSKEFSEGLGGAGNPISLSPDVWYGVSDALTVGVAHSQEGLSGFWSGTHGGLHGDSLCLVGDACHDVYAEGSVQAQFALAQGADRAIAAIGGVIYDVVDPLRVGLRVGAEVRLRSGRLLLEAIPSLYVGLNEREPEGLGVEPNEESLQLPVAALYEVAHHLEVGVQSGVRGPLDGFGDAYAVPVAVAALYELDHHLKLGALFALDAVASGGEGTEATDLRSLALSVAWTK